MVAPKQIRPVQRSEILCVLVIESTQQMQNMFHELYDTIITKIITQLRTPILVNSTNGSGGAHKTTPYVRLGVVFFGDYFPYSKRTCSTQYFTLNYREFTKTIKAHRFLEGGGRLRCAATDGLVSALEMFDDFVESDPEAHMTTVQQRHTILVTSNPPYDGPCRENVYMRYDNFTLTDVAKRMRELNMSFSLVKGRGNTISEIEELLKAVNVSTKSPMELPKAMSPSFDVQLIGINLPIPAEFAATATTATTATTAASSLAAIAPALPATAPQKTTTTATATATNQLPKLLPQKHKSPDADVINVDSSPPPTKKIKPNTSTSMTTVQNVPAIVAVTTAATQAAGSPAVSSKPLNIPATVTATAPVSTNQPPTIAALTTSSSPQMSQVAAANNVMSTPPQQQQNLQMGGVSIPPQQPQQQPPQPQQQQQQPNQAVYASIIQNLRAQGITQMEDIRNIIVLMEQLRNPSKSAQEKLQIKQTLEMVIARASQQSAANAATPASASIAPQQQQQQQQHMDDVAKSMALPVAATAAAATGSMPQQSSMMSPATQAAPVPTPPQQQQQLPPAVANQLLQYTLNAICTKRNVDIRQLFTALTPDTFEANARELLRDQPQVINHLLTLKSTFANFKSTYAAQQQQQQPQQQQPQMSSPNTGMKSVAATPKQQQQQQHAGTSQVWQGTLVWESKQGENIKHEPTCQIIAHTFPGINYNVPDLRLQEWPDQLRVSAIIGATEGFAENCINSGFQFLRIGANPNADLEHTKYFEDFCNTLREKSLYALIRCGQGQNGTGPPFPGIFITYFKNSLIALPFIKFPITEQVTTLLSRFALQNNSNNNSNNAVQPQMTPQIPAAALAMSSGGNSMAAAAAAAMMARNNSNNSVTPAIGGANQNNQTPTVTAQQIMSPNIQGMTARPNMASPAMANASVPNNPQRQVAIQNILQNHLSPETLELIKNMPPKQRETAVTNILMQIRSKQQLQQQQQPLSVQQPQQQMSPQVNLQQLQQLQVQQQQQQFQQQQQTPQQSLNQLLAAQQQQQQQHQQPQQISPMVSMAALNAAMISSAAGSQPGGIAAYASQPPNIQQLLISQMLQQQQQQQQNQHRPT